MGSPGGDFQPPVRELLFWGPCLKPNELECKMGFEPQRPERFCNVGRTTSAKDADDQVSQGRHYPWTIAGSDLGAVFVEGHVADPMDFVFNAPMAAVEFEYLLGGSLIRRAAGDSIHRFGGHLVLPEMSYLPADAKDLAHIRKLPVVVEFFADPY